MVRRHYLVSGCVQGVGFRAFTQKRGQSIGLRGRVRNLRDGRVEILASGTAEEIREFEEAIRKGPLFSKVDDLVIVEVEKPSEMLANTTGFERESDGEVPWSP